MHTARRGWLPNQMPPFGWRSYERVSPPEREWEDCHGATVHFFLRVIFDPEVTGPGQPSVSQFISERTGGIVAAAQPNKPLSRPPSFCGIFQERFHFDEAARANRHTHVARPTNCLPSTSGSVARSIKHSTCANADGARVRANIRGALWCCLYA